jgi:3-oxoacyl-[acyl-carrier protein] reductase
MDLGLRGRVALVAGGSSGLGLAVARELAAEGAHVSIGARDPERLEGARRLVDEAGAGDVMAMSVDVRDQERVREWVARTRQELGVLGIVVANAGGPPQGRATAFDLDGYREAVEMNLLSSIGLVQVGLPSLLDAGWGRILFITSRSVREPIANLALSNTARLGIVGYAKSLVADLAVRGATGVTVNVLAPGSIRTPRLEQVAGADAETRIAEMGEDIPLGRVGEPEEFAAAAAFLASDRASYITGVTLPVDGGSIKGIF